MGTPSFKECIAADVSNVFLNKLEFADTHTVNGKKWRCVVDENTNCWSGTKGNWAYNRPAFINPAA